MGGEPARWAEICENPSLSVGLDDVIGTMRAQANQAADRQASQFDAVLDNMVQGVCLFDASQRLVLSNRRYAEIYGLQPQDLRPGTTLREIVARRDRGGSAPTMSGAEYLDWSRCVVRQNRPHDCVVDLQDGRAVAIHYQPLPNGGWLATHEDITDRRRAERQVVYLASHDGLTGLPNQALMNAFLQQALAEASSGQECALLLLDIDRFRDLKDMLGRLAADDLLCQVADRLRQHVPPQTCLSRPGGDEFAIVQASSAQPAASRALAQRLQRALTKPFEVDGHSIVVGVTIGIVVAGSEDTNPDALLSNAHIALHRAKAEARGSFRIFAPEMDAAAQAKRLLERDLREAVAAMAFEVHYQPQIDIRTRRVTTFEALLRWNHPQRGNVPPSDFIPLAEEIGLIGQIGEWVLQRACDDAAGWPMGVGVGVNVSPVQFGDGTLPAVVAVALRRSGLDPSRLQIEITESLFMENRELARASLQQLRDAGVRIAIDDFGVGYSSLSYLTDFPVDKIKIDRSFVSGIGQAQGRLAIVRAIVGLCADLGLLCTAEGVETEAQLATLAEQNCGEAQGYLFGHALPARNVPDVLRIMNNDETGMGRQIPSPLDDISFFQIAEQAHQVIVVTAAAATPPGRRIIYVNPAFTRLTGYSAAQAIALSSKLLRRQETPAGGHAPSGGMAPSGLTAPPMMAAAHKDAVYLLDIPFAGVSAELFPINRSSIDDLGGVGDGISVGQRQSVACLALVDVEAVVQMGATVSADAAILAECLRRSLAQGPFSKLRGASPINISIGIAASDKAAGVQSRIWSAGVATFASGVDHPRPRVEVMPEVV